MPANIHDILDQYWGYKHFRPLQEDIITSVMEGNDTLALLPTGGGKSICFQVPAMAKEGICIVVSPLIALMKDQVENLTSRDIKAKAIYSGLSYHEINLTLDNCIHGDIKFLYLSPERLKSDLVRERLKQMRVNLLAIDEAHCISQWGYDFRPEYLQIAEIRKLIPHVPVMALTASATPEVVDDIQVKLGFKKKNVFVKSFERANISYVVNRTEDKFNKLIHILSRVPGTALVYVRNRKKTQEIAAHISRKGISADFYHAGLTHQLRNKKQEDWIKNRTRVVVCTNAFGMGIDKPDVRLVVHFEIPDSLESYYQEAGRAGRDEQKSYAVLLYQKPDEHEALERLEQSYPPAAEITRVYNALCNYYALPVGDSPDRSYDFNIADFCEKFKLPAALVYTSLKALEFSDLLSLSENFYEPSKLRFLVHHDQLYKFQVENPAYDNFIKLLLRSYGGVFDGYTIVDEEMLAKRGQTDKKTITTYLEKLHKLQILDFQVRTDNPQLTFLARRASSESMHGLLQNLFERKKVAARKLDAMLAYANNDSVCRSKKLVAYFDEYTASDCGVCDVCLQQRKMDLTAKEFETLVEQIKALCILTPSPLPEIVSHVGGKSEKTLEAIRYLLDNDKLRYNLSQQLEWKS